MRLLKADFALFLLVALTVGVATIQGSGRREDEQRKFLAQASPLVAEVPVRLGSWRMVDEDPLGDRVLAILQCEHHVNRTYVHGDSGERVMLTILLGPAGPMVVHSPEVCLPSAQYEMLSASQTVELSLADGKSIDVKRATFRSKDLSQRVVRLYYAWIRPDGSWVAPTNPRWELGGEVGLWKLQIATVLTGTQAGLVEGDLGFESSDEGQVVEQDQDAVERFLLDSAAALRSALVTLPSQ